ncbi:MAG: CheR family methyltransferase [Pseudomonadota bacterium]
MLIGVTQFFRDREAFDVIKQDVIPELFKGRQGDELVRVWSVACSTGQEPYSLAMLLAEHTEEANLGYQFQVFGSDIDGRAISVARAGIYPASVADDVGQARLDQHFTKEGDRYRIRKPLRDTVLFASQNILRDPPFSRLDLISCRNLLIYLNRDTHAQILEMFHFALKPNGYLLLGSSESADSLAEFFIPVDKKIAFTAQNRYRDFPVLRYRWRSPLSRASSHRVLRNLKPLSFPLPQCINAYWPSTRPPVFSSTINPTLFISLKALISSCAIPLVNLHVI